MCSGGFIPCFLPQRFLEPIFPFCIIVSLLNIYAVWPKEKRRKLAELIITAEDCKEAKKVVFKPCTNLRDTIKVEEQWGFLLICARNAFKEINRTVMLWVICHELPSGARFCFKCYQHHALLVNHGAIGKSVKISSQEGDPFSVICYGGKDPPARTRVNVPLQTAIVCRCWINCRIFSRHP